MVRWCMRGARVGEVASLQSVGSLFNQLAPSERALLANMTDRTHARERARAYAMLRQIEGLDAEHDPIAYGPDGRPRIVSQPLDISIAHRAGRVAVAVVDKPGRVGIDIEDLQSDIDFEGFLRYALHPAEVAVLDSLAARKWSQTEAAIALWSAKEACFKCLGYPMRPQELIVETWMQGDQITCRPISGLRAYLQDWRMVAPQMKAVRRDRWLTVVAVADSGAATDARRCAGAMSDYHAGNGNDRSEKRAPEYSGSGEARVQGGPVIRLDGSCASRKCLSWWVGSGWMASR